VATFPSEYVGRYFFGDLCGGFIRMLSPPNYTSSTGFATGISSLVDIQVHQDGSLYYLARGGGELYRVRPTTSNTIFTDNFENPGGWMLTAGANTATRGLWQRGDPQPTTNAGLPLQLGTCEGPSTNCLITGLYAGAPGSADVDDGLTSIMSPPIALPDGANITMTFRFYFGHNDNATSQDLFRVRVVGNNGVPLTVFARPGASRNVSAVWTTRSVDLSAWAGQTIQLRVEAYDGAAGSLIEAGFDNVVITRQ
jgi:aminopeptidase S